LGAHARHRLVVWVGDLPLQSLDGAVSSQKREIYEDLTAMEARLPAEGAAQQPAEAQAPVMAEPALALGGVAVAAPEDGPMAATTTMENG
jgi:hypothetical protein